jgi:hypothetical protein
MLLLSKITSEKLHLMTLPHQALRKNQLAFHTLLEDMMAKILIV